MVFSHIRDVPMRTDFVAVRPTVPAPMTATRFFTFIIYILRHLRFRYGRTVSVLDGNSIKPKLAEGGSAEVQSIAKGSALLEFRVQPTREKKGVSMPNHKK